MPNTPIHALPYPTQVAAGAGPDVPLDIKTLGDALDGKLTPASIGAGTPAVLSIAAGKLGRRHLDTNTGIIYFDTGASWLREGLISGAGNGLAISGLGTLTVRRYNDGNDSGLAFSGGGLYVLVDDVTLERTGIVRIKDGGVSLAKLAAALKPSAGAADGDEAVRALGTGAGQASPGIAETWIQVGITAGAPAFGYEFTDSISWRNEFAARPVAFMRHHGTTYLRGVATFDGSSVAAPGIFNLPVGYRPPATMTWPERNITVGSGGGVSGPGGPSGQTWVLDGICFRHA